MNGSPFQVVTEGTNINCFICGICLTELQRGYLQNIPLEFLFEILPNLEAEFVTLQNKYTSIFLFQSFYNMLGKSNLMATRDKRPIMEKKNIVLRS